MNTLTRKEDLPTDKNYIGWTAHELKAWYDAGLIPKELLNSSKTQELATYLLRNKERLYNHYKRNTGEDHYQITLPPQNELDQTYELHIIDKRTGKIVSTLEKTALFELCEGVTLQIKATEKEDWEKETADAKNLNKEQHETLKAAIKKIGPDRPLTRKEITTIIQEVRKSGKKGKIRHAGHFTDCKLQYECPQDHNRSLFDFISPITKEKIEASKIESKAVGIKLTPSEDKLINAIYKLLHDKSENHNIHSELFYSGNESAELVPYGGEELKAKSAFLRIKPTELYKEYVGENNYSGKEIENIKNILYGLNEKKFLIIYDRKRKVKTGTKTEIRTDRIEEFQNLIKIVSFFEDLSESEVDKLDNGDTSVREKKEELVIALNPLLTDQINSKYVEYPTDINKRTMIASGGHLHVTESINTLRDYLLREISNKRYKCEINKEKLPYILKLDNYIKSHRKKLIADRLEGAIKANRNLGIILNVEIQEGVSGQLKYVFHLNPSFE